MKVGLTGLEHLELIPAFLAARASDFIRYFADKDLRSFLKEFNEKYKPETVYYPGSGFHKTPRKVFGDDKVVHLIDNAWYKYLATGGLFIFGDYRYTQFPDNYFDATFIWGSPLETTLEAIPDFLRVTKNRGKIIGGKQQYDKQIHTALAEQQQLEEIAHNYVKDFYIFEVRK